MARSVARVRELAWQRGGLFCTEGGAAQRASAEVQRNAPRVFRGVTRRPGLTGVIRMVDNTFLVGKDQR